VSFRYGFRRNLRNNTGVSAYRDCYTEVPNCEAVKTFVKAIRPRPVQRLRRAHVVMYWKPNTQETQTSHGGSRTLLRVNICRISQISSNSTALIPSSQYFWIAVQNTKVNAVPITILKLRAALKSLQLTTLIVAARIQTSCKLRTVQCMLPSLYHRTYWLRSYHLFFLFRG
jgi:hypothetical protein